MTKATLLRLAQHFNSLGRSKEFAEIEAVLNLQYQVDKNNVSLKGKFKDG